MTRVITACQSCGTTLQTDEDQIPPDSDTFAELVLNLDGLDTPADHVHTLTTETVS